MVMEEAMVNVKSRRKDKGKDWEIRTVAAKKRLAPCQRQCPRGEDASHVHRAKACMGDAVGPQNSLKILGYKGEPNLFFFFF